MKILFSSRSFFPDLGGSQKSAYLLAREFSNFGHDVKIITETVSNFDRQKDIEYTFDVIRRPNISETLKLFRWCDIYFQNGISLRDIWPLLLIRKPWVVRHQGWIRSISKGKAVSLGIGGKKSDLRVFLKHFVIRFSISTAVSQQVADHLSVPCTVIPSPYDADLFHQLQGVTRDKDLIFLGRLVSEKGVCVLLDSLNVLKNYKIYPTLTIVGDGTERADLQQKIDDLNLSQQVKFFGSMFGKSLVNILNQHRIMIVPSLSNEPSGGVATEGIACGCVVVGSQGGGLKDVIGDCGVTFPNGDHQALANILLNLLNQEDSSIFQKHAVPHLQKFSSKCVSESYLKLFKTLI